MNNELGQFVVNFCALFNLHYSERNIDEYVLSAWRHYLEKKRPRTLYTFLSFDDGIRQKICSRMLYGITWGTRGWVYISSHDVGYDIPSLSARYCVAF